MEHVRPCNDENAIKIVALAFEFEGKNLQENTVEELIKIYRNNKEMLNNLPRVQKQQTVRMTVGNNQAAGPSSITGVTFDHLTPSGGQKWAVMVNQDQFVVSCSDYSSWTTFWTEAKAYITTLIEPLKAQKIKNITVEYADEFAILKNDSQEWIDELFNRDSHFLPSYIFDLEDLWHSHNGFFSVKSDSTKLKSKNLNVINIEQVPDEESGSKIMIRTQNKTMLDDAQSINEFFGSGNAEAIVDNNHEMNKNMMKDLLSAEMLKKINLGD